MTPRDDPLLAARPIRVLVVDDNADAADTLAMLLDLWGYEAAVAYDGAAGLRAAAAWNPDCALIDIYMPGIDGYEVASRIRPRGSARPALLVALSALSGVDHVEKSVAAGFDYRFTKPADPNAIAQLLAKLDTGEVRRSPLGEAAARSDPGFGS